MYRKYKTVGEFKRSLPEVLERINSLKEIILSTQETIEKIVLCTVKEMVSDVDYGSFTTEENYIFYCTALEMLQEELDYLQGKIKALPDYKQYYL